MSGSSAKVASGNESLAVSELKPCRTCGRMFKNLAQHRCSSSLVDPGPEYPPKNKRAEEPKYVGNPKITKPIVETGSLFSTTVTLTSGSYIGLRAMLDKYQAEYSVDRYASEVSEIVQLGYLWQVRIMRSTWPQDLSITSKPQ